MQGNDGRLMRKRLFIHQIAIVSVTTFVLLGCDKKDATSAATKDDAASATAANTSAAPDAKGATDGFVKISQYGGSEYCSIASAADGMPHAVYTDQPDPMKPHYLYYRGSKDGGTTWSEPKNLSDDETATPAAYCRVLVDGDGKVYAVWKYLESNNLDGAGGGGSGTLAYRVLDGGAWSPAVRLGDKHHPMVSYFAAPGPDKKVNVVWSQGNLDVDWQPMGGVGQQQANLIRQSVLAGTTPQTRDLVVPKPVPTREQIDAAHTAGHDIPYEDQYAKADGLWDLRGYIAADGVARFIGDHQEPYPNPDNIGAWITYFDGRQQHKLYEYKKGDSEANFRSPWTLMLDAQGKEHVVRMPMHSEKAVVRDYPIVNGSLGDPTDIVSPDKPTGSISGWQALALPGGGMAVTAIVSQKGGWAPDDLELLVSHSTGEGKWSTPLSITHNTGAGTGMSKGAITTSTTYYPKFAEPVALRNSATGVIMVNTAHGVVGVNNAAVTGSGQVVTGLSSYSSDAPWVFFTKL